MIHTIVEAKHVASDMEKIFLELINKFEEESDLLVEGITLNRDKAYSGNTLIGVSLDIRLKQ